MKDIRTLVDKLMSLDFKWNGKEYIHKKYDDIIITQDELFNSSDEDFNVKFQLIKDKIMKR